MTFRPLLLGLVMSGYAMVAVASVEPLSFSSPEAETRYQNLIEELRCLVCQNQNLAASDADLAKDLRRETYNMVEEGKTEDEVIELANDTEHGLAAGIFTRDSARSLRMADAVRAGIVWVNTYRIVSPIAEFGGVKGSGYGRESGFQAMYDYTRPKTVWMNTSDAPMANPFVMR